MTIYEVTSQEIRPILSTTFRDSLIREREGLQPLLRDRIDVIAPGCLVVAEEFCDWDGSRRRIDLLALDSEANLVVIELKRTEDGGHMDLQALRYASMVSTMTFEQVVRAYEKFLESIGRKDEDAESNILEHLDWSEPDEDSFAQDVRIVLASAQFRPEITTTVLWLNDRGLDIRCVRLIPYADGDRILLDVQPIIPLQEAEAYQVRVQEKSRKERESRHSTRDFTKYNVTLDGETLGPLSKREMMFRVVNYFCDRGISPDEILSHVTFKKGAFTSVSDSFDSEEEFIIAITSSRREKGRRFDKNRWYTGDDERIEADGRTYVFSNQWGQLAYKWIQEVLAAFPQSKVQIHPVEDG